MRLFRSKPKPEPAAEAASSSEAPAPEPPPEPEPLKTSPTKADEKRDKHSRIASIPSSVHYRFSKSISIEKRLRLRATEGDADAVKALIGMGADVNSTNEVRTTHAFRRNRKKKRSPLTSLILVSRSRRTASPRCTALLRRADSRF